MRYSEYRPHPALFPFVECLWFASDEEPAGARPLERVLPDGCIEWQGDDGSLHARVEGTRAGKAFSQEWRWVRAPAN